MLAAVFIGQGVDALRSPKPAADAARPALEGLQRLPDPLGANIPTDAETFAKVNAGVQIGGGLLLATGKLPRLASAALAFTVIPGNLGARMFWNEADPERKAQKRREFLADVSLLGGLIIASADTAGKPSLAWRGRRAARKVSDAVSSSLPGSSAGLLDSDLADKVGHGLQVGAERGRGLAVAAGERSAPLLQAARKRGAELASDLAEAAQKRSADLAEVARERGPELASIARDKGTELAGNAKYLAREQGGELVGAARAHAIRLKRA